jgi:hypothetical protein
MAQITSLSSLKIKPSDSNANNGFYLPPLTAAKIAAIPAATLVNGALIYNATTNVVQAYVNGAWVNLNFALATIGGGLTAGSPLVLPSGASAVVEAVVANQVNGFMYYNTTANTIKTWINNAFVTVTTA